MNYDDIIEQRIENGELSVFALTWQGVRKGKDGYYDINNGSGLYCVFDSFDPINLVAVAFTGGEHRHWMKITEVQNGEVDWMYCDGDTQYFLGDYEIEQMERVVPITYRLEKGIEIDAVFLASPNDTNGEIQYLHVLTNQRCEEVGQVLSGWSEQDRELNEKWGYLVELIEEANEQTEDLSSYWWGDESPIIIEMG